MEDCRPQEPPLTWRGPTAQDPLLRGSPDLNADDFYNG